MEFIAGSSLAPPQPSTPHQIRYWASSSDGILRRNGLPESYTAFQLDYQGQNTTSPDTTRISNYNNFAITDHHQDSHHYALEIAQQTATQIDIKPTTTDANNNNTNQYSASTLALQQNQTIAINGIQYPYFPLSTTHQHRPLGGPLLVKIGVDDELVDVDIAARIGSPNVVARGYVVFDHNNFRNPAPLFPGAENLVPQKKEEEGQTNDNSKKNEQIKSTYSIAKDLVYGGEITVTQPTYNIALSVNSQGPVVGGHVLKSIGLKQPQIIEATSTTPSMIKPSALDMWFIPSTIDTGMEYFINADDGQDTFTLGALAVWGDNKQPTKQFILQPPTTTHSTQQQDGQPDVLTITKLPPSAYVNVNGIGTAGFTMATSLSDKVDYFAARQQQQQTQTTINQDSSLFNTILTLPETIFGGFWDLLWGGVSTQQLKDNNHCNVVRHAALNMSSRFELSLGSFESAFNIGFQRIVQTLKQDVILNDNIADSTNTNNIQNQHSLNKKPWEFLSAVQQTLSFSTTKGISYDHTLSWSPHAVSSAMRGLLNQPISPLPQGIDDDKNAIFVNFGISKLLPVQTSEAWARLHHAFPHIPALHQPYTEVDALPTKQISKPTHNNNNNAENMTPERWYPANYITNTDNKMVKSGMGPITERLSLCSHNGEWTSTSPIGASPSPVWNPYDGVKFNFSCGFTAM